MKGRLAGWAASSVATVGELPAWTLDQVDDWMSNFTQDGASSPLRRHGGTERHFVSSRLHEVLR